MLNHVLYSRHQLEIPLSEKILKLWNELECDSEKLNKMPIRNRYKILKF